MNAECALFGHRWHWCFVLRLRQCDRCWQFDAPRSIDFPAQPRSAPPRLDQAADWPEGELRAAWGNR